MEATSPWSHFHSKGEHYALNYHPIHDAYLVGTIKYCSTNFTRITHELLRTMFYNARLARMGTSLRYNPRRILLQYYVQSSKCYPNQNIQ